MEEGDSRPLTASDLGFGGGAGQSPASRFFFDGRIRRGVRFLLVCFFWRKRDPDVLSLLLMAPREGLRQQRTNVRAFLELVLLLLLVLLFLH
jgi:hypothetical protein